MIRSKEVMRSKNMDPPGKERIASIGKPSISKLAVIPTGAGVRVDHFHDGKHGVAASHSFKSGQADAFMEHMDQHMGKSLGYAGKGGDAEAHSSKAVGGLEEE